MADRTFRFDFRAAPRGANDSADVCLFAISLRAINGSAIARTDGVSFGVVPLGDDGSGASDAKIRPNTAVVLELPAPWKAAIESVSVSGVKNGTLLAVVGGDTVAQRANIDEALDAFDASNGTRTVTKGVWIVNRSGAHRAPPAIILTPVSSWAVVHLRGAPFSLDGAEMTRPIGTDDVMWVAVEGGTTVAATSIVDAMDVSSVDGVLIGAIVGGVVGGLLLLCGAFAAGVWWTRKSVAKSNGGDVNPSTEMRSASEVHEQPDQPQHSASFSHADYRSVSGIMMAGTDTNTAPPPSNYVKMSLPPTTAGYRAMPATGYEEFQSARGPAYEELQLRPNTSYADASAFTQQQ